MADIFKGDLTMADDWGNVVNEQFPDGAQASGQSVQNFIKSNLKNNADEVDTKPACFHTIDDGDNNQNVLLAFKTIANKDLWLAKVDSAEEGKTALDFIEDELVQTYTRLNKSLPQAYDSVLLENKMDTTTIISTDNTVKIRLKFSSTHYEPSGSTLIPSQTGEEGLLIMQRRTNGGNWETRYETTIPSIDLNDNIAFTEIDLTSYLTNGNQEVQIMVTGKTTNLSTTWLKYNITKTNLGLVFATPWKDAQTTNYMQLSYYINGAVDKTLNIKITGPGGSGERIYTENIGSVTFGENTGTPKRVSIYDSNLYNYKVVTEGVHNIEAWISVNNTNIESDHLYSQVLMIPNPTTNSYIIINELNTNLTNWTNQELFKYALYNPAGDTMPISFILGDYNTDDVYLKYEADAAKCAEITTLTNVIEVETEDSIVAKMDITSNGLSLLEPIEFNIANIAGYSPTEGANFIFNPKSRNNDEANPEYIENAVTGQPINAVWNGFNFTTDGWVKDDNGNKCLRILAGQTVEIDYNPFDGWEADKSCTIEMVIASRNISSETHPILSMSRRQGDTYESYNGLEIWPTKAIYKTIGNSNELTQDILFREGVATHIAVNIMHNMYSYKDATGDHPINLVRIFVNGVINREFAYTEDTLGDVNSAEAPRKIILGNVLGGADLDVYSIRIYKSKLSSANILQDYIASLPTTAEKDAVLAKNDILGDNSAISYEKVKNKYNTLLWKYSENEQAAYENGEISTPPSTRMVGVAEGNHDDTKNSRQYGDLVIRIIKEDGTVDTDRSGTLNDMSAQGQGTSSMGYWKWNQRWVFQKEGEDKDKDGIISKYTSKFTAENPNSKHNGKKSWQPFAGAPFAKKLDAKINWASPMQSHKIGSTGMYNDLWKLVVKSNEMMDLGKGSQDEDGKFEGVEFTGTNNGYADCRVTVGQVPFMVFCQKDKDSDPEFYGLYTMGPSKGDKPTFGYNDDSSKFANFSMIEGCDNGTPLVMGRVPWNDTDVTQDSKGEVFLYNGKDQYELSMGEAGAEYIANSPTIQSFKAWNRFVYLLNPDLHYFDGTLTQLIADDSLNTEAFYWTTKKDNLLNADAYNVYRYDMLKKKWVNSGIEYSTFDEDGVGTDYDIVNLKTQTGITSPKGTYSEQNQAFINRRAELFAEGIEQWFDKDDFMFTMMFLKLIAASDNWAKNTYIYNAGFTDDEGNLTSKWRFFQDDLDTIFSLDNSGYKVKPYYVEEHDKKESDNSNYFNSDTNALYCLAELAWAADLRSMMNKILSAASSLGGSVAGCFDKYYNEIPRYFPQQAYNEITKLLYEDGYINQKIGNYKSTTNPLAQAVGDQLEAEIEWQRLRSIYLSSFASFGEFSAADGITSTGALNFRSSQIIDTNGNTKNAAYRFEFTPHMWLYPSMSVGGSSLLPTDQSDKTGKTKYNLPPRTKAGDKVLFTLDAGDVDGNTQMYIRGINYYNDIGDLGSIATNPAYDFNLAGERLLQFIATDANCENGMPFRPPKLGVPSSGMNNIKKFIMNGRVMGNTKIINGDLDLRGLWRLEEVDITATSATNVLLPQYSNITSLKLPATLETLNLADQQRLSSIEIMGVQKVKNVKITNSPKLNSYDIFNLLYNNGTNLQSCDIDNINWENVSVNQLKYLVGIYDCSLKGVINVKSKDIIDFNLKAELMDKFGNIDANPDNGEYNDLRIVYDKTEISPSKGKVIGESYITVNGTYQYSLSISGNSFKDYKWIISSNNYATITENGLLTYTDNPEGGMREATITCEIYLENIDGTYIWVPISKKIYFEPRVAQIGDYVYADGTISAADDLNVNKTVIGLCYYVNPQDSTDRRMVALSNLTNTYWGLGSSIEGLPNDAKDTSITNISGTGTNTYYVYLDDLLDQSTSDGFKIYPTNTAVGDIGLITLQNSMTTEIGEFKEGSVIPVGLYKTLQIIEHRNEKIINTGKYDFINVSMRIPGKDLNGNYSVDEYNDLITQLENIKEKEGVINQCYYYPAASYCYAYEPDLSDLNNKFKKHNWYLPTFGELTRIWYCDTSKKFDNAISNNIYTKLSSQTWSSTEHNVDQVWPFILSGSYIFTTGLTKVSTAAVRPVARF